MLLPVRSVCLSLCKDTIHLSPAFSICRRSNMRHWHNAGLMLAHRLWRWANIIPVLGYRVVFGATLNVGQPHRRGRANINICITFVQRRVQHQYCRAKPKGSNCLLYKKSVTAFWFCRAEWINIYQEWSTIYTSRLTWRVLELSECYLLILNSYYLTLSVIEVRLNLCNWNFYELLQSFSDLFQGNSFL